MRVIQGFVNISAYVSNVPGVISEVGEISTFSRTFAKEKGDYRDINIPGYNLITFSSFDTEDNELFELDAREVTEILTAAKAVVAYATTFTRPFNQDDFSQTLRIELNSFAIDFQLGPLVETEAITLPSFITWKNRIDGSDYRIWLSDNSFQQQYTGFEITVIPPFENLDEFFKPYFETSQKIDEISFSVFGDKIQEAKDLHPETILKMMDIYYHNRYDRNVKKKTTWGILGYGSASDHIDNIKDKLADYVLSNSEYGQEQWELIFPEIFRRTEMILVPHWDNVAVENISTLGSLYSSVIKPREVEAKIVSLTPFYPAGLVEAHHEVVPYTFKTIALSVVAGPNNAVGKTSFKEVFPDYLPIPSTSTDFARMSLKTQEFCLFIDDLVLAAETAGRYAPIKRSLRLTTRMNKLFISATFDGIHFLVATKSNEEFKA